ncbi:MAG: hypothetical protein IBJ00_04155, partial [Alphaproteobacteria bacterium]|nr:hypothetical protein [Alphaproteobacteria bacterium]
MRTRKANFPFYQNYMYLKTISGIEFTGREIDIIACLLSGRSAKTIASLLGMAESTVTTHIRNIMLKIESNSRDSIRDFIEKSDKFSLIKKHYLNLLVNTLFKQQLQKISALIRTNNYVCLIVYERNDSSHTDFIHQLENYLNFAGIKTILASQKQRNLFPHLIDKLEAQAVSHIIYNMSENMISQLQENDSKEISQIKNLIRYSQQTHNSIIFLLEDIKSAPELPQEICEASCVSISKQENFHLSIFEILKKLFFSLSFDKIIEEFNQKYEKIHGDVSQSFSQTNLKDDKLLQIEQPIRNSALINYFKREKIGLYAISFVCLILGSASFFFLTFDSKKPVTTSKYNQEISDSTFIRADLPLPNENAILLRTHIITKIKDTLKKQPGIWTIAIIGPGGAGKTTLARQYAKSQKASVIWEINAETHESLINSFEKLGYEFSKTAEEKNALKELQNIQDLKEREEKILLFVKQRLRSHPNWLLIYDNVENFIDIHNHFPSDINGWGKGQIIITTRNNNIKNWSFVNNAFQIDELSSQEKLTLFLKIMKIVNLDKIH